MRSRCFSVTDGQTDGWTTCRSNTALCLASRDKKMKENARVQRCFGITPRPLQAHTGEGLRRPCPNLNSLALRRIAPPAPRLGPLVPPSPGRGRVLVWTF